MWWLSSWWLLTGCRHDEVVFPAVLAPLEANRAAWPAGGTEVPDVVSGGDDDLWWAHSRGYVQEPPARVWAALTEPDVFVDRREVDSWEFERDVLPEFDRSWVTHHVVEDVLTVDYDLTWAFEIQAGEEPAVEYVVARWDKTDGTPFIDVLRGTLELEADPTDPNRTRISLIEHLKASLRDDETIAMFLRDLHASIAAVAHGDRLPTY